MRDSDYVLLCVSLLFLSDTYTCVKDKRCSHHIVAHNNEIILTKKSEENGAKFIKTETKNSVDDCLKSCCDLPDCTVAVFENRERHICYMFDCKSPSVCSFMPHDNYVTLTKVIGEPKNVSHPQPPVKAHVKKPVGLGAHCDEDRVCADTYSTCSKSHVCYCSPGYIQKHGKCVKSICSKPDFVFQCDDTSRSPACVAIYDTCNGIPQCGDGSDEKNCVANGAIKDTKTHSNDRSQDTGERRENRLPKRPKPPVRTPSAGRKESPASSPPPHRASGHKKAPVVIYASGSNSSSGSRAAAKKPQDAPIPSVVSAEYVEMLQKSYQQSKIAVVVLGLTLGVTAFALTFFICRVRHIKNRLRRGKALTSDEADYLINGMYL